MTVKSRVLLFATLSFALVASFQACSRSRFSSDASGLRMQGNGDSYSGKPIYYLNFDQACTQVTSAGKPFPSAQIFLVNGVYQLVRDNCQDVTPPREILQSEITAAASVTEFSYQGRVFRSQTDLTEYMITPLLCPPGRTTMNLSPPNLVTDSLNMLQNWNQHPIEVTLEGSLSALPLFRYRRTEPNALEPWQRVSQAVSLTSNTLYSFSFLLKPGNVSLANVDYFMTGAGGPATDQYFKADLNLIDGSSTIIENTAGITGLVVQSQRYGSGWLFTVFFNPGAVVNPGDLGVSTASAANIQLGDYIYGTANRLHSVNSYCSP